MRQLNIIKIPATTSLVIAGTTFIYFPQTSSCKRKQKSYCSYNSGCIKYVNR